MSERGYSIVTHAVDFAAEVLTLGCILPCLLWPYLRFSPNVGHVPLSLLLSATVNRPGMTGVALVVGLLITVAVYATKGRQAGALSRIGLLFAACTAIRYSYDSAMILPWLAFILCLAVMGDARLTIAAFLYIMLIANVTVGAVAYAIHLHQFSAAVVGVRASGLSGSPILFSPLCMLTFFGSAALLGTSKRWVRLAAQVVAIMSVVMLLLTFTRAGWIATAIASAAGIGYLRKSTRLWMLTLSVVVMVGAFLVRADGKVSRIAHERSLTGRTKIWALAGSAVLQHPIYGLNPTQQETLQQRTVILLTAQGYKDISLSAKNTYLDFAIDYGVAALMLLVLMFAAIMRKCLRTLKVPSLNHAHKMIVWWCLLAIIGLGLESLVDDTLFFHSDTLPVTVVLLTLLGLAGGIAFTSGSGTTEAASPTND